MQGNDESIVPQNSNTTTVSTGEADKDLIRMAEHHNHPAMPAK